MNQRIKPTHVYVARKDCGCCIGLATDMKDKATGEAVAEFIESGLNVTQTDWKTYTEVVCKEETFMNCPHGQLPLFSATSMDVEEA